MSMCAGKVCCEIYRDKKYCRTATKAADNYSECNCRHAVNPCETDRGCALQDICPTFKWREGDEDV